MMPTETVRSARCTKCYAPDDQDQARCRVPRAGGGGSCGGSFSWFSVGGSGDSIIGRCSCDPSGWTETAFVPGRPFVCSKCGLGFSGLEGVPLVDEPRPPTRLVRWGPILHRADIDRMLRVLKSHGFTAHEIDVRDAWRDWSRGSPDEPWAALPGDDETLWKVLRHMLITEEEYAKF